MRKDSSIDGRCLAAIRGGARSLAARFGRALLLCGAVLVLFAARRVRSGCPQPGQAHSRPARRRAADDATLDAMVEQTSSGAADVAMQDPNPSTP